MSGLTYNPENDKQNDNLIIMIYSFILICCLVLLSKIFLRVSVFIIEIQELIYGKNC